MGTSLINKQLFGKYRNIQYAFHLIRFNYNPLFQRILMKILEDETDQFLFENMIDIAHYTLPKLSNQLLQPVIRREPFSYKAFQVGVLYRVYSKNYGFAVSTGTGFKSHEFKNMLKHTNTLSFDKAVRVEDTLESIEGLARSLNTRKLGPYIPFVISVLYEGHSSSISLGLKMAGGEIENSCVVLADPMTLARF